MSAILAPTPLFLALDVDDPHRAMELVRLTAPIMGGFKIGPRLCLRAGQNFIAEVATHRPVFIDNKYFDIPSTMVAAVEASFAAGASFVTVHAQAGAEALGALAKLESQLSRQRPFKILAVTVLTSFSQTTLPPNSATISLSAQVELLAELAIQSGLSGLVASAHEVAGLRKKFPSSFLVVPGVRLPGQATGDQTRVADPESALRAGASCLVVGRPILEASNPEVAAREFAAAAAKAFS